MRSIAVQAPDQKPALKMLMKVFLACGILSSLLYVCGDVFAAMSWQGYSYANQAVSELAAIGAPTRPLMVGVFSLYNTLVIAFAGGVWGAAGTRRATKATAVALVVYALVGQVTTLFSPMNLRGSAMTATDVGHIVLTVIEVLSIVAFMAFGSGAHGRAFRLYSILTIVVLMIAGFVAGAQATSMTAAAASTPWTGIIERVNIYAAMLWVLVLSITLFRARAGVAAHRPAAARAIAGHSHSYLCVR